MKTNTDKRTKALGLICLVLLVAGTLIVTGVIPAGNVAALYVVLPLGAICFGLYLMTKVLEKESQIFTEEEEATRRAIERVGGASRH